MRLEPHDEIDYLRTQADELDRRLLRLWLATQLIVLVALSLMLIAIWR